MDSLQKLLELEEKHNEILSRLDELDDRIIQTLKEWSISPGETRSDSKSTLLTTTSTK